MCVDLSKPVYFACAQQLARDFSCQEFGAVFLIGTKSDHAAEGFIEVMLNCIVILHVWLLSTGSVNVGRCQ